MPSNKERYTITIWFFDNIEWAHAKKIGLIPDKTDLPEDDGTESVTEVRYIPANAPDSAREPSGNDLTGLAATNEPFIDPTVQPTVTVTGVMRTTVEQTTGAIVVTVAMPNQSDPANTDLEVKNDKELIITNSFFTNSPLSIMLNEQVDDTTVIAKYSKKREKLKITLRTFS